MRKWIIISLGLVLVGLPKTLNLLGIAGTPDDLNVWGRWMEAIGAVNVISLIILALGGWLFYLEWYDRKTANRKTRLSRLYRKRTIRDFNAPIEWFGYPTMLQHLGLQVLGCGLPEDKDFLRKSIISIEGFTLLGKNKTNKRIRVNDAFIQSLVSGRKIPLKIDRQSLSEIDYIPGKHVFQVRAAFQPVDGVAETDGNKIFGIPIGVFRNEFSCFRLVFETENFRHEETFESDEIDSLLYGIVTSLEWSSRGERKPIFKD